LFVLLKAMLPTAPSFRFRPMFMRIPERQPSGNRPGPFQSQKDCFEDCRVRVFRNCGPRDSVRDLAVIAICSKAEMKEYLASARPILNRPHFFRSHDVALGFSATNVDLVATPYPRCSNPFMGSESENAAKKLSMPFAQFVRLTYRLASRESSMNSAQSELLIPCVYLAQPLRPVFLLEIAESIVLTPAGGHHPIVKSTFRML